ncbi:MAG: hypothetical protein KGL39_09235 [Patescibacteria group bacterium]|nr:hypothetical protein [Patescibacteria group bacterium]
MPLVSPVTRYGSPPAFQSFGEDTLTFSLGANATTTSPFPHLPRRQRSTALPQSQQASSLIVPVGGLVRIVLSTALTSGALTSVYAQSLTAGGTVAVVETLGHEIWREFRVVLTAGAAGAEGSVTGRLLLFRPVPFDTDQALRGIIPL